MLLVNIIQGLLDLFDLNTFQNIEDFFIEYTFTIYIINTAPFHRFLIVLTDKRILFIFTAIFLIIITAYIIQPNFNWFTLLMDTRG